MTTIKTSQIQEFAATASGPFSYVERSEFDREFKATAFWRTATFTGHRILCAVRAEDYPLPDPQQWFDLGRVA